MSSAATRAWAARQAGVSLDVIASELATVLLSAPQRRDAKDRLRALGMPAADIAIAIPKQTPGRVATKPAHDNTPAGRAIAAISTRQHAIIDAANLTPKKLAKASKATLKRVSKLADELVAAEATDVSAVHALTNLRHWLVSKGAVPAVIDTTYRPALTTKVNEAANAVRLARQAGGLMPTPAMSRDVDNVVAEQAELIGELYDADGMASQLLRTAPASELAYNLTALVMSGGFRPGEVSSVSIAADGTVSGASKQRGSAMVHTMVSAVPHASISSALRAFQSLPPARRSALARAVAAHVRALPQFNPSKPNQVRDLRPLGADITIRWMARHGLVGSNDAARSEARTRILRHTTDRVPAERSYAIVNDSRT